MELPNTNPVKKQPTNGTKYTSAPKWYASPASERNARMWVNGGKKNAKRPTWANYYKTVDGQHKTVNYKGRKLRMGPSSMIPWWKQKPNNNIETPSEVSSVRG